MTSYKNHIVLSFFGVALGTAATIYLATTLSNIIALFTPIIIVETILLMAYFSVLPDIDHQNSIVSRLTTTLGVIIIVFGLIFWNKEIIIIGCVVVALVLLFNQFPHRGIIHSVSAAIIFSGLTLFLLPWPAALLCFLSYMTHLVVDGGLKIV